MQELDSKALDDMSLGGMSLGGRTLGGRTLGGRTLWRGPLRGTSRLLPFSLLALGCLALVQGCSGIDERDPRITLADPEQAQPSLEPTLAGGGSAGSSGVARPPPGGVAGSAAVGSAPSPAPAPEEPQEPSEPDPQCPSGDNAPCTAPSSRAGACSQPGRCIEYCAAGVSFAGACLVQPG